VSTKAIGLGTLLVMALPSRLTISRLFVGGTGRGIQGLLNSKGSVSPGGGAPSDAHATSALL